MKVLIVGADKDACIEFANALNSSESGATAIIGGSDYSDATGKLGRDVDAIALISQKPIADAIEANRNQKVRAAVCRNAGDVRDAISCGTNIFVVSAFDAQRHQTAAVAAMIGKQNGGFTHAAAPERKKTSPVAPVKQQKKQEQQPQYEENNNDGGSDDDPGIKSKLRNIFGIE